MPNTSPLKIRLARTQVTEMGKESRDGEICIYITNKPVDSTKNRSISTRNFDSDGCLSLPEAGPWQTFRLS